MADSNKKGNKWVLRFSHLFFFSPEHSGLEKFFVLSRKSIWYMVTGSTEEKKCAPMGNLCANGNVYVRSQFSWLRVGEKTQTLDRNWKSIFIKQIVMVFVRLPFAICDNTLVYFTSPHPVWKAKIKIGKTTWRIFWNIIIFIHSVFYFDWQAHFHDINQILTVLFVLITGTQKPST